MLRITSIISGGLLLAVTLGASAPLPLTTATQAPVTTTRALVDTMQKRYGGTWYSNATFVQKTITYAPDGTSTEAIWYEALAVPSKLRIDYAPTKDGNGLLFVDGQLHSFKAGKLASSRAFVHPLLLLGFDIYKLPADVVMSQLAGLKFDVSVFHEDTWQGRPVFVVGAPKGDERSSQFWIDRDQLYFVRMIRPSGANGAQVQETQFNKYQRLAGGWMAPEVLFFVDGKPTTKEEYSELRANVTLDAKLFDPQYFATVHWRD
jgi:hypothetical protein